jgi:dCTP deaminase
VTVLSGQSIMRRGNLLTPMVERSRHPSGMSFGVGPAGYDVRVAEKIMLPPQGGHAVLSGIVPYLPSFVLASTVEKFNMHDDLIAFVHDKSTLARRGLAVQNTVIEPGWSGYLTLELTNHGTEYIELEAGSPIAQIVFHLLDEPSTRPYDGRYQHQEAGPQEARFLKGNEDHF